MRPALAIAAVCASLGLFACGNDDSEDAAATDEGPAAAADQDAKSPADESKAGSRGEATSREESKEPPGITIATGPSQFGEVLFDGDRRAIYYFDKETTERSECYGGCAAAWPPVLTEGEPRAGGSAEAKLLGTTRRDDGTTQVTYAGRPLYYYIDDPAGELLCHNVEEFGGLWLAVQTSGAPVA